MPIDHLNSYPWDPGIMIKDALELTEVDRVAMAIKLTFLEASWSSFNSFMILLLLSIALDATLQLIILPL